MLYIIGRDIGSPLDNTLHCAQILTNCDVIATEDTRTFQKFYTQLCQNFSLSPPTKKQKIIPFHDQNEYKFTSNILSYLYSGQEVAIISESGMPLINDPGGFLLSQARSKGLTVTIIPGPTAFTTALAGSGLHFEEILFLGYFPKKMSALLQKLEFVRIYQKQSKSKLVLAAYESSHRIAKTLETLKSLKDLQIIVCKDLTKSFEQISDASDFQVKSEKGEYVLIMQFTS